MDVKVTKVHGVTTDLAQSVGSHTASTPRQSGVKSTDGRGALDESFATRQEVDRALAELNKGIRQLAHKRLQFQLHEATDRLFVRVIDTETDEVIKEIPPEKVLDAVAKMMEFIGILLDERV